MDGLITEIDENESTKLCEFDITVSFLSSVSLMGSSVIFLHSLLGSCYSISLIKVHFCCDVSTENHNAAESGGASAETVVRTSGGSKHSDNP